MAGCFFISLLAIYSILFSTSAQINKETVAKINCTHDGFLPHPANCKAFYWCSMRRSSRAILLECDDDQIFDTQSQTCTYPWQSTREECGGSLHMSNEVESAEDSPLSVYRRTLGNGCVKNGYIHDDNDCTKFYRCVNNGRGRFIKYEFNCEDGTVWDPEINGCNHPWSAKHVKCGSGSDGNVFEAPGAFQAYSVPVMSSNKPKQNNAIQAQPKNLAKRDDIIPEPENDCCQDGFLGHNKDCNKFYRCVEKEKGIFQKLEFSCGPGTVWDVEIEACNHPWATRNSCGSKGNQLNTPDNPDQLTRYNPHLDFINHSPEFGYSPQTIFNPKVDFNPIIDSLDNHPIPPSYYQNGGNPQQNGGDNLKPDYTGSHSKPLSYNNEPIRNGYNPQQISNPNRGNNLKPDYTGSQSKPLTTYTNGNDYNPQQISNPNRGNNLKPDYTGSQSKPLTTYTNGNDYNPQQIGNPNRGNNLKPDYTGSQSKPLTTYTNGNDYNPQQIGNPNRDNNLNPDYTGSQSKPLTTYTNGNDYNPQQIGNPNRGNNLKPDYTGSQSKPLTTYTNGNDYNPQQIGNPNRGNNLKPDYTGSQSKPLTTYTNGNDYNPQQIGNPNRGNNLKPDYTGSQSKPLTTYTNGNDYNPQQIGNPNRDNNLKPDYTGSQSKPPTTYTNGNGYNSQQIGNPNGGNNLQPDSDESELQPISYNIGNGQKHQQLGTPNDDNLNLDSFGSQSKPPSYKISNGNNPHSIGTPNGGNNHNRNSKRSKPKPLEIINEPIGNGFNPQQIGTPVKPDFIDRPLEPISYKISDEPIGNSYNPEIDNTPPPGLINEITYNIPQPGPVSGYNPNQRGSYPPDSDIKNTVTIKPNTDTSTSNNQEKDESMVICTKDDFMPDPKDCKKFYRCVKTDTQKFIKYEFSCGEGTIWDNEAKTCNHPLNTRQKCGEQSTPVDQIGNTDNPYNPDNSINPPYLPGNDPDNPNNPNPDSGYNPQSIDKPNYITPENQIGDPIPGYHPQPPVTPGGNQEITSNPSGYPENGNIPEQPSYPDSGYTPEVTGSTVTTKPLPEIDEPLTSTVSSSETSNIPISSDGSQNVTSVPSTSEHSNSSQSVSNLECDIDQPTYDVCTHEGFMADSKDCKKFYRCVNNGITFTKYEFTCGEGTMWDIEHTTCMYPFASKRVCGDASTSQQAEKVTPVTPEHKENTTLTDSTLTSSTVTAENKLDVDVTTTDSSQVFPSNTTPTIVTPIGGDSNDEESCRQEGFMADSKDCRTFYRCVYNENRGFIKYEFSCGEGTIWDIEQSTCNYPYNTNRQCDENISSQKENTPSTTPSTDTDSQSNENTLTTGSEPDVTSEDSIEGQSTTENELDVTTDDGSPELSVSDSTIIIRPTLSTVTKPDVTPDDKETTPDETGTEPTYTIPTMSTENLPDVTSDDKTTETGESGQSGQSTTDETDSNESTEECKNDGFMADSKDCTVFYRCVLNRNAFTKYMFKCGEGTIWDSDLNTCNHPSAVRNSKCSQISERPIVRPEGTTEYSRETSTFFVHIVNQTETSEINLITTEPGLVTTVETTTAIDTESNTVQETTPGSSSTDETNEPGSVTTEETTPTVTESNNIQETTPTVTDSESNTVQETTLAITDSSGSSSTEETTEPGSFSTDQTTPRVTDTESNTIQETTPTVTDYESTTIQETTPAITDSSGSSSTEETTEPGSVTTEVTTPIVTDTESNATPILTDSESTAVQETTSAITDSSESSSTEETTKPGTLTTGQTTPYITEPEPSSNPTGTSEIGSSSGPTTVPVTQTTTPPSTEEVKPFLSPDSYCVKEGFFANIEDCSKFYRCVFHGNGFIKYEFVCGPGTIWDPDFDTCNHPDNVAKKYCQQDSQSSETPHVDVTSPEGETIKPETQTPLPPPGSDNQHVEDKCSGEGFYPSSQDCTKFFRCVSYGEGQYWKFDFSCGEGTIFDPSIQSCNYPHATENRACGHSSGGTSTIDKDISTTTISDQGTTEVEKEISATTPSQETTTEGEQQSETTPSHETTTDLSTTEGEQPTETTSSQGTTTEGEQQTGTASSQETTTEGEQQTETTPSQETTTEGEQQTETTPSQETTTEGEQQTETTPSQQTTIQSLSQETTPQHTTTDSEQQTETTLSQETTTDNGEQTGTPSQETTPDGGQQTDTTSSQETTIDSGQQTSTPSQETTTDGEQQTGTTSQETTTDSGQQTGTPSQETTTNSEQTGTTSQETTTDNVQQTGTPSQETTTNSEQTGTTSQETTTDNVQQTGTPSQETTTNSEQTGTTSQETTTDNGQQTGTPSQETTTLLTTEGEQQTEGTTSEQTTPVTGTTEPEQQTDTTPSEQTTPTDVEQQTTAESTTNQIATTTEVASESTTISGEKQETTIATTESEQLSTTGNIDTTLENEATTTEGTSTVPIESTTATELSTTSEMGQIATQPDFNYNATCPISQLEGDQVALVCPTGFRRHPKYCNLFYQCTGDTDTLEVKILVLSCPPNTIYDDEKIQCVPPEMSTKKCEGAIKDKNAFRTAIRSMIPMEIDSRLPFCPKEGAYALNPLKCTNNFIKCERAPTKSQRMRGFIHQCPKGFIYWPVSKQCECLSTAEAIGCVEKTEETFEDQTEWVIPVEVQNIGRKQAFKK